MGIASGIESVVDEVTGQAAMVGRRQNRGALTMRVGILGAGAIGGVFAAHLVRAGADVQVLARNATLDAVRRNGLLLESDQGQICVRPNAVSDKAADLGAVDILIVAVKGQDTAGALAHVKPMLGDNTRLLSLQNGFAGLEIMEKVVGADRVLSGITYVPATVLAPGHIRHTGRVTRTVFGPYTPDAENGQGEALAKLMQVAGLDVSYMDEPLPAIWSKFVMLAPFHSVSALTRAPLGHWIDCAETQGVYRAAMAEVVAVAKARDVALPPDLVERHMAFTLTQADRRTRASMLDDLEQGRPTELEATIGWLVRAARQLSVPVPIHDLAYALLKPMADGRAVLGV
ncbi:MAG: hypothetical protein CML02_03355 [Pseudooceanicola sp.]|nr:hypothetical protein [Pseudooceanicola sp.]